MPVEMAEMRRNGTRETNWQTERERVTSHSPADETNPPSSTVCMCTCTCVFICVCVCVMELIV